MRILVLQAEDASSEGYDQELTIITVITNNPFSGSRVDSSRDLTRWGFPDAGYSPCSVSCFDMACARITLHACSMGPVV